MDNQIFRKKNIERVSSPEQLNDYVRVSNPGVWMVLTAVIVLLFGICVWGVWGNLETILHTVCICQDGKMICYVSDREIDSVKSGMTITVQEKKYTISSISEVPVEIDEKMDAYALYIGGFKAGDWVYEVIADTELSDGTYEAEIVTDSIHPISFLMN